VLYVAGISAATQPIMYSFVEAVATLPLAADFIFTLSDFSSSSFSSSSLSFSF